LNQTSKQEETRKMKQEMFRSNQMLSEEKSSSSKGVKDFKLEQDKFNNSEFIDSGNKLEKLKLDKRSQMRDYRMQLELQKMCWNLHSNCLFKTNLNNSKVLLL